MVDTSLTRLVRKDFAPPNLQSLITFASRMSQAKHLLFLLAQVIACLPESAALDHRLELSRSQHPRLIGVEQPKDVSQFHIERLVLDRREQIDHRERLKHVHLRRCKTNKSLPHDPCNALLYTLTCTYSLHTVESIHLEMRLGIGEYRPEDLFTTRQSIPRPRRRKQWRHAFPPHRTAPR